MGFWIDSSCPTCGKSIDTRMYGLSSGLGPPMLRCGGCAQLIKTTRREVAQMGPLRVVWLLLASGILVLGGGLMGGLSMAITRSFWIPGTWPDKLSFDHFFQDGLIWGSLMIALQVYRVIRSLLRSGDEPFPASYWNLQIDMQGKMAVLLTFIPVGSWLLSLVFGP